MKYSDDLMDFLHDTTDFESDDIEGGITEGVSAYKEVSHTQFQKNLSQFLSEKEMRYIIFMGFSTM